MKNITGYEGLYAASKDGKIWAYPKTATWHTGRFLKPWLIGRGYQTVSLYDRPNHQTKFLVHRLVALAYVPNPENLPEINHKDGNRLNNSANNLEWVTSKQNKAHAWKAGLYTHKGSNHYLTSLNNEAVKDIKKLLKSGVPRDIVADEFSVSYGIIRDIDEGFTWKHII